MKQKKIKLLLVIAAVAVLLTGCSKSYPITVGGATVAQRPDKVAALSPIAVSVLVELGMEDRLVGMGLECAYSGYTEDVALVGPCENPEYSTIKESGAAVVFADTATPEEVIRRLRAQGHEVAVLPAVTDGDSLKECFLFVAEVMEGGAEGRALYDNYFNNLQQQVAYYCGEKQDRGTYLYITDVSKGYIAPAHGQESFLLEMAGLKNSAEEDVYAYSIDNPVKNAPQWILVTSQEEAARLSESDVLGEISPVKEGRVLVLNNAPFATGRLMESADSIGNMLRSMDGATQ